MASVAPHRVHFQQLADVVHGHAAGKGWPAVTYQAAFITVESTGTGNRWLEGNSVLWNADWDTEANCTDHPVAVGSGEESWQVFLATALYPDLHRANEELQKR